MIDKNTAGLFRQNKMIGQAQAGDETLFQPRRWEEVDTCIFIDVIRPRGQILTFELDAASDGPHQPCTRTDEQVLSRTFHARQPDHLAGPNIQVDILYFYTNIFERYIF